MRCRLKTVFALVIGMLVLAQPAYALDTKLYVEACAADPSWEDESTLFTGSAVTPQLFCDCLATRYGEEKLSQSDVDFLTKLRNNSLTDDEMQNYATGEDLFAADERFYNDCKTKLGVKDLSDPAAAPEEGSGSDDPVGDEPADDNPGSGPD